MNAKEYENIIKEQMRFDSGMMPSFKTSIQILCEILEERDRVYRLYLDDGAHPLVEFESDRHAINMKPNPLLRQWQELNASALLYLRDLGLTAAGLRKLQGQIPEKSGRTTEEIMQEVRMKLSNNK